MLDFLERVERESSLLLLLDVGRGERSPLDVDGRESDSCVDFFLHARERPIQDGDNRSLAIVLSVDMTSSDIESERSLAEAQGFILRMTAVG